MMQMAAGHFMRYATVLALLMLAGGQRAEAQIGGLIKKKVGEAVKGPEKPADPSKAESKQGFVNGNADVLEITSPVLEGFLRGAKVEVALRKEFAAELAKYPTREQYRECTNNVMTSAEGQKLMQPLLNLPDNATTEQLLRAKDKVASDMEALTKKKCPLKPDDAPDQQKRFTEIREKAAAAAVFDAPSGQLEFEPGALPSGPAASGNELNAAPTNAFAGMTPRQYEIVLERTKRFCEELKNAADKGIGASGGVSIPGSGSKVFWVYTAEEAKTLSQANCQRVYDIVGQFI